MQVRDAGDEAWLGKEAPEDSSLDISEGEAPLLMLPAAKPQQVLSSAAEKRPAQEEDDPKNPLGFGALLRAPADKLLWVAPSACSMIACVESCQHMDTAAVISCIAYHNGMRLKDEASRE